jgi:enoyl-CoA hydratase
MKLTAIKFKIVSNPKRPEEKSIGIITLNRPQALNALDVDMRLELNALLDELKYMNQVRVVILTGEGRAFCAGGDLPSEATPHGNGASELDTGLKGPYKRAMEYFFNDVRHDMLQRMVLKIEGLPQPTIAAINGITVGGGLETTVACDIRIASEKARFTEAGVAAGFVAEVGAAFALPRLIGKGKAIEMILTGDVYNAEQALEMGLVDRVVPHEQLMERALDLAGRIACNPYLSVRRAKELIHMYWSAVRTPERVRRETEAVNEIYRTDDCEEGVLAFNQKRKPTFKGPIYPKYLESDE